jgi:hypothetical protein
LLAFLDEELLVVSFLGEALVFLFKGLTLLVCEVQFSLQVALCFGPLHILLLAVAELLFKLSLYRLQFLQCPFVVCEQLLVPVL